MSRLQPLGSSLVLALSVALCPSVARSDDAAEAQLHFQLGATNFQSRNYAEALTHFLAAQRLAPTANTLFNIAQTYLVLDRPAEAWRFFHDYVEHPSATPVNRASSERNLAALAPRVARVAIRTTPPGATLFVDRIDLGDYGVSPRSLALTPGSHEVIARLPGYSEGRSTVTLSVGTEATVTLSLEARLSTLRVTSTPSAAMVTLDGNPLSGVTPLEQRVTVGTHRVRLRREGYLDLEREVTVTDGGGSVVEETLARDLARASLLSVSTSLPGATVTLRGVSLGVTPLSTDVSAGPGELRVYREGSPELRREVLLRPGRELNLRVGLGREGASRPRWIPALMIGGGAVTLAGVVIGVLAWAAHQDFDQAPSREALDRTHALNLAADLTVGVGLGALVGGIIGLLATPDPRVNRVTVREEGLR